MCCHDDLRFHFRNHTTCGNNHRINEKSGLDAVNSGAAEQLFADFDRLSSICTWLTFKHMQRFMQLYIILKNRKKQVAWAEGDERKKVLLRRVNSMVTTLNAERELLTSVNNTAVEESVANATPSVGVEVDAQAAHG